MAVKTILKLVSQEDLAKIHEASLKILAQTGVVFHHAEALRIFKRHGAMISDKIVRLPRKMVEDALSTCPPTYKLKARNDKNSITVGDGYAIGPSGGTVFIQDLNGQRRTGTLRDVANFQKLYQSSNVLDIVGTGPIEPGDVHPRDMHLFVTYEILKHTDKPFFCYCNLRYDDAVRVLDLVEIAFGEKELFEKNHVIQYSSCISSPLAYHDDVLSGHIEFAKRNQPISLTCCCLPGATAPIMTLNATVQQNAEILAGLVFTQLINPGNPVMYSPVTPQTDFKSLSANWGSPQAMFNNLANIQMASEYYHLPTRSIAGATNTKIVDAQAGYETMQNLLLSMLAGANIHIGCLGNLDSMMTLSYEKHIIDEELVSRAKTICEGFDNPTGSISSEPTQTTGPNGNYLTHPTTLEHFRDQWQPTISDWETYDEWKNTGCEDIAIRAHKLYKQRINEAPETLLDPEPDKELRAYIKKNLHG